MSGFIRTPGNPDCNSRARAVFRRYRPNAERPRRAGSQSLRRGAIPSRNPSTRIEGTPEGHQVQASRRRVPDSSGTIDTSFRRTPVARDRASPKTRPSGTRPGRLIYNFPCATPGRIPACEPKTMHFPTARPLWKWLRPRSHLCNRDQCSTTHETLPLGSSSRKRRNGVKMKRGGEEGRVEERNPCAVYHSQPIQSGKVSCVVPHQARRQHLLVTSSNNKETHGPAGSRWSDNVDFRAALI
ncbi:hypothetical protein EVAR_22290_1 [Eumeta japonica]|uniref:Uncharacterized protein n=1 Tax=Eumeta variegata TaxID=151549 RepID=A0A4C1UAM7_EUMVA|nr:hypothetical protein EVAR_22290_1 [Eumeta japonica]